MDREALIETAAVILMGDGYGTPDECRETARHLIIAIEAAFKAAVPAIRADERAACIALVYGHAGSDNDAQRIVDAIKARGEGDGS